MGEVGWGLSKTPGIGYNNHIRKGFLRGFTTSSLKISLKRLYRQSLETKNTSGSWIQNGSGIVYIRSHLKVIRIGKNKKSNTEN